MTKNKINLTFHADYWRGEFQAMASPCQILIDSDDQKQAIYLSQLALDEAMRIQNKFSRYRADNIVYQLNNSDGRPVEVDEETASLLDYANLCYELSDGKFDITSGVLREAWTFDGSDHIPTQSQIDRLLPRIGWPKLTWSSPLLTVPRGMQIDLGGIGKEYAVDRTLLLLTKATSSSVLVNYGGDLCTAKARRNGHGWIVGVEDPSYIVEQSAATKTSREYELERGGIATSGDSKRFLLKDGQRYSHILDPATGWPVKDAPHSVTTVANSCTEAGVLATLASLQGPNAEEFLEEQAITYWVIR